MKHLLLLVVLLSGCSSVKMKTVTMQPGPDTCQVVETRVSVLSTLVYAVCWDEEGQVIGFTGSGGTPAIQVPLSLINSGSTLAAGVILGKSMIQAAESIPRRINTDGTMQVEIPPVEIKVIPVMPGR